MTPLLRRLTLDNKRPCRAKSHVVIRAEILAELVGHHLESVLGGDGIVVEHVGTEVFGASAAFAGVDGDIDAGRGGGVQSWSGSGECEGREGEEEEGE